MGITSLAKAQEAMQLKYWLEFRIQYDKRLAAFIFLSFCQIHYVFLMQALEYQVQQGMAEGIRQDIFLVPLGAQHEYGHELHASTCVIKLLAAL